jgi:hypothetical protein
VVDFSRGYQPPGVYVEAETTQAIAAVGVGDTVLCLVGDGIGYQVNTENVSYATVSSVPLAKKWVDTSSIVVSAVLDTGDTTFALTTDYTLSTTAHVTTVTKVGGGDIPTDRLVRVTYRYADDDYFALNKFDDPATYQAVYGSPLDATTGAIASPLSFAAQLAFANGANIIYAVALDHRDQGSGVPTLTDQLTAAYAKILPTFGINVVVPLWSDAIASGAASSHLTDLATFLANAEAAGSPMMAFVGLMGSYATNDPETLASGIKNKRIVLAWPERMLYFNGVLNQGTAQCDGIYLAAAYAGWLSDQPVNRGLTQAKLQGFTGIPADVLAVMTKSKKDTWSSLGVSVSEINRLSQLVVRHGVTTDVTNRGTREISVVRETDTVLDSIQVTLINADMIGDPIDVNTPLRVSSLVDGALQSLLSDGTIASYQNLVVTQAPGPDNDPTVIEVTFSFKPTYPLNYIAVTLTLDLTTNAVSTATNLLAA